MTGKRLFSLLLSLILVFVLAYSCLAQSIRPFYNGSGNVRAIINNSSYSVKAEAVSSVTKITVSGTLYEKGLFGIYGKVDSCSSSSSNQYCTASSSYSLKSGKTYRLDYSATFYYSDGTNETISNSQYKNT